MKIWKLTIGQEDREFCLKFVLAFVVLSAVILGHDTFVKSKRRAEVVAATHDRAGAFEYTTAGLFNRTLVILPVGVSDCDTASKARATLRASLADSKELTDLGFTTLSCGPVEVEIP